MKLTNSSNIAMGGAILSTTKPIDDANTKDEPCKGPSSLFSKTRDEFESLSSKCVDDFVNLKKDQTKSVARVFNKIRSHHKSMRASVYSERKVHDRNKRNIGQNGSKSLVNGKGQTKKKQRIRSLMKRFKSKMLQEYETLSISLINDYRQRTDVAEAEMSVEQQLVHRFMQGEMELREPRAPPSPPRPLTPPTPPYTPPTPPITPPPGSDLNSFPATSSVISVYVDEINYVGEYFEDFVYDSDDERFYIDESK